MINQQTIAGSIVLAIPVVIVYQFYPYALRTLVGQVGIAIAIGAYVLFMSKKQGQNQTALWRYTLTGEHKRQCDELIRACGVDPKDVQLRYAYAAEQTALANYQYIVIDPLVWQGYLNDPQAQEIQTIFEKYIEPSMPVLQKQRISALRQTLNPQAARFVLRHELYHVISKQSQRKIILIGLCAALAVYVGIAVGMMLLPVNGMLAIVAGMVAGTATDIGIGFLRNFFWQQKEERAADAFAVKHSMAEEIQEAAAFFKYHQEILDGFKEPSTLKLSSEWLTGHPHGTKRYVHLMAEANKKRS